MASHNNIFGAITYHTYSRAILRPYGGKPDDEMETDDKWVYEAVTERGTELTGYPRCRCTTIRYHPKEVITGVFDDWLFDHKGVFAITIELWDSPRRRGRGEEQRQAVHGLVPQASGHRRLQDRQFVNEHAPDALVPWRAFDHPQLGKVEIGGWHSLYSWRNPPMRCSRPRSRRRRTSRSSSHRWPAAGVAHRDGDAPGRRCVAPGGRGREPRLLPTHVSAQALRMKAVQPVRLELTPGDRRRARGRQAETGGRAAGGKVEQAGGGLQRAFAHRQPREGGVGGARAGRRHGGAAGVVRAGRRGAPHDRPGRLIRAGSLSRSDG